MLTKHSWAAPAWYVRLLVITNKGNLYKGDQNIVLPDHDRDREAAVNQLILQRQ